MSTVQHRSLLRLGYGLALVLLVGPVADLAVATFPWQPSSVAWRFGALGLLGNALIIPVVALGVLALTAGWLEHRRLLRTVAVLSLLGCAMLFFGLMLLGLDAFQLRRNVRADLIAAYDFGALRVALNYLLAVGMSAWIGGASWRASVSRKITAAERHPAKAALGARNGSVPTLSSSGR